MHAGEACVAAGGGVEVGGWVGGELREEEGADAAGFEAAGGLDCFEL